MQQYNTANNDTVNDKNANNSKTNNSVETNNTAENTEEITNIVKNICELSEKVFNIIKEYQTNAENDISDEIAITIGEIYDERNSAINKLKAMYENGNLDVKLLENNPQWNKYVNEIMPLEDANIAFLDEKTKEKKNKLNELLNNKSLMIYNKKVNLSYENKFL